MRVLLPLLAAANPCVPVLETADGGVWQRPDNSWPASEPPSDLVGQGWSEGMVAPDMVAIDQHGNDISLWQFYGMVVVVDVSTIWCAPCQALALGVQETHDRYADEGFMYLTLLPENNKGEVPTVEELNSKWAEPFGITAPVLSDTYRAGYEISPNGRYPWLVVIDREMRILEDDVSPTDDEATIRRLIESVL